MRTDTVTVRENSSFDMIERILWIKANNYGYHHYIELFNRKLLRLSLSPVITVIVIADRIIRLLLRLSLQNICHSLQCPPFEIMNGSGCFPWMKGFKMIPKSMSLLFREVNGTEHLEDPYSDFENDVVSVIKQEILSNIFDVEDICGLSVYRKDRDTASALYESEFIVDVSWWSYSSEELIPDNIKTLLEFVDVTLNISNTTGDFKVKLIRDIYSFPAIPNSFNTFLVRNTSFTYVYHDINIPFTENCFTRLELTKLLICERIVLKNTEFNITEGDIFLKSGDVIRLPEWYFVGPEALEFCLEDYTTQIKIKYKERQLFKPGGFLDKITIVLSFVCLMVSIVCLFITISTYLIFKRLRTTPGKINLLLCVSLLLAQLLQQFTIDLTAYQTVCIVCGSLIHFFWLSALIWMNVSCFNLLRRFSPANISAPGVYSDISLGFYAVYVLAISTLLVCMNVVYSFFTSNGTDFGYGGNICFVSSITGLLLTFIVPIGLIAVVNLVFLSFTVWWIAHSLKPQGTQLPDRNNALIYLKMSTLTGACWLFGFFRIWTGLVVFEVLFILANASHGFFLMMSFVCNRRVLGYYKSLFLKHI